MPSRIVAAEELADHFTVVAHRVRIRMIEELRDGEIGVNELAQMFGLSPSRVSQLLSLLRSHCFVEERRKGRHHFYHLTQPEMAEWIVDGLAFVEARMRGFLPRDLKKAKSFWGGASA